MVRLIQPAGVYGTVHALSHDWLIDSGVSHHMMGNFSSLYDIMYVPECSIGLPDGTRVVANYCGSVQISANLILKNVLFVPNLKCHLISVGCLIKFNNFRVIFDDCYCVL